MMAMVVSIATAVVAIATPVAFAFAGFQMLSLKSVAGDSVAEFFYHAMGLFSLAMAGMAILVAMMLNSAMTTSAGTYPVPSGDSLHMVDGVDYKECIECLEPVKMLATRCSHCGADLLTEELADEALETSSTLPE